MTWSITDTELSALTIQKSKIINIVPKTPRAIKKLVQLNVPISWLFHGLWLYSQYTLPRYIDGLVQERCNSIASALELNLFCTNPSTKGIVIGLVTTYAKAMSIPVYLCLWPRLCPSPKLSMPMFVMSNTITMPIILSLLWLWLHCSNYI